MDDLFFIAMSLMALATLAAIVLMVRNRLRGKDETDSLFVFKRRRKDRR